MSFKYDYNMSKPFAVVHRANGELTTAVACHAEVSDAESDAAVRNARAKEMDLACDYVVRPLADGVRGAKSTT